VHHVQPSLQLKGVGLGLLLDTQDHGPLAIDRSQASHRPLADAHLGQVGHPHRRTIAMSHHHGVEVAQVLDAALALHHVLGAVLGQEAGRDVAVGGGQRVRDIAHAQVEGPQPLGVDHHLVLLVAAAEHGHLADAGHGQQPPPHHGLGHRPQLHRVGLV